MKKIALAICSFLSFISCNNKFESTRTLETSISESVYASGFVKSRNQYQVFSKINGIIKEVYVQKGDVIQKGQLLFRISNENSRLNVQNAELAARNAAPDMNQDKLNELRLNINLAQKKMKNDSLFYARQKNLWEQQIGTRIELEQRELNYAASKSAYESAKFRYQDLQKQINFSSQQSQNNVSISKTLLGDYDIKSDAAGRVYSIFKEKGEMANTQSPLALIGDAANFYILLHVDENDIVKLTPGQKVFITMDSYKEKIFEALIEKINPLMNERSRTFEIEAAFIQTPEVLYPNLTLEANIQLKTKSNALVIPRSYLIDEEYVWVSKKEKRKIKTGLKNYQNVEVLEGLSKEQEIYKPAK